MINRFKELRNNNSEEGFTLIELMIVVVIIGILAAIAIPIFMNQQKTAVDAGVKSDVKLLTNSIIATLVKAPTSPQICGTVDTDVNAVGVSTETGTTLLARANVSDKNTVIVVSRTAVAGSSITAVADCGTWDDFAVTGYNPYSNFGTLNTGWSFSYKTGESEQLS